MGNNFTQLDGVTLKEHLEKLLLAQYDYFSARLIAIEKAIDVAKVEQDRRLENMNEFRAEMEKHSATFASRAELDLRAEKFADDIEGLKAFMNQMTGKADQSAVYIAYGISIIGIVIGVIGLLAH